MQYSMNDHKNQPIIKRTGKKYLWIGIEKPGNTHTCSAIDGSNRNVDTRMKMKTQVTAAQTQVRVSYLK